MADFIIFRIRSHKHRTGSQLWTEQLLCMLYVLLVWWGSDFGAAVGWSSCFYCFVSQIRNPFSLSNRPHNEKFNFYVYKSYFSKFSNLVWRHAYCGACLIPQPEWPFLGYSCKLIKSKFKNLRSNCGCHIHHCGPCEGKLKVMKVVMIWSVQNVSVRNRIWTVNEQKWPSSSHYPF